MCAVEIFGDPTKLAEYVINKTLKRIDEIYSEYKRDLNKLLHERIEKIFHEEEKRLEDNIRNLEYSFESYRSKLDIEERNRLSKEANQLIDEVFKEARERIINFLISNESAYRKFLKKNLERVLRDIKSEHVIIETDPGTIELIKNIISELTKDTDELGNKKLSVEKNERIKGGFIAYSETRDIVYRYDLDTLINSLEEELKLVISKTLFGG
ncbi:MAG: V-type ATP synthase subunit E [Sulfolobales archaeon]